MNKPGSGQVIQIRDFRSPALNVVSTSYEGNIVYMNNPSIFELEWFIGTDNDSTKEMDKMKTEIQYIKNTLEVISQVSSDLHEGSDILMEELKEKIYEIDKKMAVIEERTKKIDNLPTRDEMRFLISDVISNSNFATKEHVEVKVEKARNAIIGTIVAGAIAIVGILVAVL